MRNQAWSTGDMVVDSHDRTPFTVAIPGRGSRVLRHCAAAPAQPTHRRSNGFGIGTTEEPALPEGPACGGRPLGLPRGFDPFGNGRQPEPFREAGEAVGNPVDRGIRIVQIRHEGLVQFQARERQVPEMSHRGVARTEVICPQLYAGIDELTGAWRGSDSSCWRESSPSARERDVRGCVGSIPTPGRRTRGIPRRQVGTGHVDRYPASSRKLRRELHGLGERQHADAMDHHEIGFRDLDPHPATRMPRVG